MADFTTKFYAKQQRNWQNLYIEKKGVESLTSRIPPHCCHYGVNQRTSTPMPVGFKATFQQAPVVPQPPLFQQSLKSFTDYQLMEMEVRQMVTPSQLLLKTVKEQEWGE